MDRGEPRQNWVEGVPVSLNVLSPNWQQSVREQTENSLAVKVLLNTRNFSPGHLLQFCYDHTRVTCRATGREVIIQHVRKCGLGRTPQGWAGLPRAGQDSPGLARSTQGWRGPPRAAKDHPGLLGAMRPNHRQVWVLERLQEAARFHPSCSDPEKRVGN